MAFGVHRSKDGSACGESGDQASFGNAESLLLHDFMNADFVYFPDTIKLINAADATCKRWSAHNQKALQSPAYNTCALSADQVISGLCGM